MIIGGLDIGTTGCKIALYDDHGSLLDTYYREYDAVRSATTQELDMLSVETGVFSLLREAFSHHPVDAIGVTSFGETFVLLDREDRVLAPSMLYTDPRGEEEALALTEALGEDKITAITGAAPHAMYSISKLMWIKKHWPDIWNQVDKILLGQDFVVYLLTGARVIDFGLAARTGALDVEHRAWAREILDWAGIDPALLSTPVPAGTPAGVLLPQVAARLGIPADHPVTVVSCCHDQQAAMLGSGICDNSVAMDGTGTVECIPVLLDRKPTDRAFYRSGYTAVPYAAGGYACYAFSYTGGAMLKWFRDNFAGADREPAVLACKNIYEYLNSKVPEGPTGILVLPHFAGAATPYMDLSSRSAVIGMTLDTSRYELYKALMEGTSYEMLLNFRKLGAYLPELVALRATGGGAASDLWLQIKADILGLNIEALDCPEVGAAGTVALTGYSLGVWPSVAEAQQLMAPVRAVFTPRAEVHEKYTALYDQYKLLYGAVKSLSTSEISLD